MREKGAALLRLEEADRPEEAVVREGRRGDWGQGAIVRSVARRFVED
jgi:hypothetical protein